MYETHQSREESDSPREPEGAGVGSDQGLDTLQLEEQCPEAMEYVNQLIARMKGVGSTIEASTEPSSDPLKRAPRATAQKTREPEQPRGRRPLAIIGRFLAAGPFGRSRRY